MIALVIVALFVSLCLLGAALIVHEERPAPVQRVQTVYRTQPMPAYAAKYFERICSESELEQLQQERWQD